jgi:hypothetical protein
MSSAIVLTFSVFNRQSTENYYSDVIQTIVNSGNLPTNIACEICDQPQVYSYIAAMLIKITGLQSILIPQLLSAIGMVISLLILIQIIDEFHWQSSVQGYVFALIALNPALIKLGAMAQPDAWCIMFSLAAIWHLQNSIESISPKSILWFTSWALFASLMKSTGLIVFFTGILIQLYNTYFQNNTKKNVKVIVASILIFMVISFWTGGYLRNFESHKQITTIAPPDEKPNWFENTEVQNPGIRSIADGLCTFRFYNLLQRPHNIDGAIFPAHRTSIWSQLYGNFWFAHFAQKPSSHEDLSPETLNIGRIIFILALFPSLLFVIGFWNSFTAALKKMVTRAEFYSIHFEGALILLTLTSLFFIIKHVLQYRDYTHMNINLLLPFCAAFLYFLGKKWDEMLDDYGKWFKNFSSFAIILLLMAQVQDLGKLILAVYSIYKI